MYVKQRVKPVLADETCEFLTSAYSNLRKLVLMFLQKSFLFYVEIVFDLNE